MSDTPALVTPCVGVCEINTETGYCKGCLRTMEEIAIWRTAGSDLQLEILGRLKERRRRYGFVLRPGDRWNRYDDAD